VIPVAFAITTVAELASFWNITGQQRKIDPIEANMPKKTRAPAHRLLM
jgi:hypothetical protein